VSLYLLASVKLRYGTLAAFSEIMSRLIPVFEQEGWKLIGAYTTLVGDSNEVVDLWEIPDADAVNEVLGSGATAGRLAADPAFVEAFPRLQSIVVSERFTLLNRAPFNP
jgi:hypothetical protein